MKNALIVSIAFPPKYDSEGLQVAKYMKYLKPACEGKFRLSVVTSKQPTLNMPHDSNLELAGQGFEEVIELPIFEDKYFNYVLRNYFPTLFWRPDSKMTFHWQWRRALRQLKNKPDLIYSRSFPASSAIMAMKLKKELGVPWIFHLSDPWADSPHIQYGSDKAREHNQNLERLCFENADVISLTSNSTIRYFQEKYPELEKRYEFFPNVFDSVDIPDDRQSGLPRGKIRLIHTGGLAGSRSPEPLLRVVCSLPKEVRDNLDFIFAGQVDRANRRVFEQYKCDCVSYIGPLDSYKEAIALQRTADVLVLIDFPVENPGLRVYFLSKLLDYHITGKPILGITDSDSEGQSFLEGQNSHAFDRHDPESIREFLIHLVTELRRDESYFSLRPLDERYSARFNAEKLTALFQALV